MVQLRYPYSESVPLTTYSKDITTQNQEWSADDDSIDIITDGNVDAVPDIQVTGGVGTSDILDQSQAVWGGGWAGQTVSLGQTFTTGSGITNISKVSLSTGGSNYTGTLKVTIWDSISKNIEIVSKSNIAYTGIQTWFDCVFDTAGRLEAATQYYMEMTDFTTALNLGKGFGDPYAGGQSYGDGGAEPAHDLMFKTYYNESSNLSIEVYNTDDTTVKCLIADEILYNATHRINTDGTGSIAFSDNFTTDQWVFTPAGVLNVTQDTTNDELDIADDGYIYWKCDTKFPINGTPTFTSRVNITSGVPTIQISTDASTWYDIDTAIVDDVETVYPLDSDGNLSLAGKTMFYYRYDCVKAAAATVSIKHFELDINMHTIYAKNPKITKGSSASTFRIDQDPDSSMACTVDLILRHKWWI